jgi:hypothetical protein
MLAGNKHDCVEQKIKSRRCLRKVDTPGNFTKSSTTLQLVLRAHPQRNVLGLYKMLVQNNPLTLIHHHVSDVISNAPMFNNLLHASAMTPGMNAKDLIFFGSKHSASSCCAGGFYQSLRYMDAYR